MKKILLISGLCYLSVFVSGCSDIMNAIRQERTNVALQQNLLNRTVYVCTPSDYGPAIRKIKDIQCNRDKTCDIYFESNSWYRSRFKVDVSSENYLQQVSKALLQKPFCSAEQFQSYQKSLPLSVTNITTAIQKDKELSQKKDVLETLELYNSLFYLNGKHICETDNERIGEGCLQSAGCFGRECEQYPLCDLSSVSQEERLKIVQTFTQPNTKFYCHMTVNSPDTIYRSDECILARRNTQPSAICNFNYKKYLPANTSIKTDEQFLELTKTYHEILKKKRCENNQTLTSSERNQCVQNSKVFILQLASGNAPHCRNKYPQEYNNYIKEKLYDMYLLNGMVSSLINDDIFTSQTQKDIANSLYNGAFGEGLIDLIKGFGYDNFCTTQDMVQDIQKANKELQSELNN